jgi:hypothetical protein
MARPYSRRTFLRQTQNSLIKQYFDINGIDLDVDWQALTETAIGPLANALDALDEAELRRVDSDFSQVMQLACGKGVQAIIEEASLRNQDWSEKFARMHSDYERAMWTFLNQPDSFKAAGAFHEMDRSAVNWHRFVGFRLEPQADEESTAGFAKAMVCHYRKQGLGRHCHVDVYRRVDPTRYCYFAYPEDAASTDLGYDERGRFKRRPRQSAFEVIFVYRPEGGILELHARGDKRQKEALAELFCVHALGLVRLPNEDGREPFNLAVLKDPTFEFRCRAADRVQSVDVRLIRLDLPFDRASGASRRITLEAKSTQEGPRALYGLIRDAINTSRIDMEDVQVGKAKLCFTFRPIGNERPKSLTFEIGYPDRCTLKDDPHDQIARRCLYEWGIAHNEGAPGAVAKA